MRLFTFDDARGISCAANTHICLVHDYRIGYEPTHLHDYYELVYIYDGDSNHVINERTFALKRGSVVFLKPGNSHSIFPTTGCRTVNVCFTDLPELNDLIDLLTNQATTLAQNDMLRTETLLYLLEEELRRDDSFSAENSVNCVRWMLSVLLMNSSDATATATSWGKLISYLSDNYATATLSDAAKVMNLSVSHFCRIFKRDFSTSFYQYLTTYRIYRAKVLLSTTNLTVNQVADAVGYENGYSHFYQAFQSREHMTPHEFRKNRKQLRDEAEHQSYISRPGAVQRTDLLTYQEEGYPIQ